ncbi:MAG: PQQ-dependent dehydrogenase, methanol/ethanol family [Vicinamibacterales bacterium]
MRATCRALLTTWLVHVAAVAAGAQVPYERIVNADAEPGAWLTYSGTYKSQRYSSLDQITRDNVKALRPVWMYQVADAGYVETTPLVVDGVMYVTEPPTVVTALDLKSGRMLWTWSRTLPANLRTLGFGRVNRGVAVMDDMVFVGTLDGALVALDAKTGAVRWETKVADNKSGHAITAAPLAIKGKVLVGISGGEAGIRGFIDAYDARSGDLAWRSWTIPAAGQKGVETWEGDSWKHGAGATWLSGSYDPELNLVYWGIGNPGPDWNGDARKGDNLYTSSLLAIDPGSGTIKWHFQFTPHDTHDWDANQIPVLADLTIDGAPRKVVIVANRNAFYYVLDRATGEFLVGRAYAKQTWAKGLDGKGRPIVIPGTEPSEKGTLVYPSLQGATNWFSPTFSPQTGLFYVSVREMGSVYYKTDVEFEEGSYFTGGGESRLADEAWGAVRALEATTGRQVWDFKLPSPPWSGLLSTAGGLVFGGANEGNIFALDAKTGQPLWQFQTGGAVRSNPMSYLFEGKQHVVMAAGHAIFVFALP